MTYLTINGKTFKGMKGLEPLFKEQHILEINDLQLLKNILKVDCADEFLLCGLEMCFKYKKHLVRVVKDLKEIGEYFCIDRYEKYCDYKYLNPKTNGEEAFTLKYGKDNYRKFYDKSFLNKPNMWTVQYYVDKGYSEEEGLLFIAKAKEGVAGSLKFFINKYGEERGTEEYKLFGEKSRHTEKGYLEKYGEVYGKIKWGEYVKKKRDTSTFNKEVWLKKYPKDGEERFYKFIKQHCSTSNVDFWMKKGLNKEDARLKVESIKHKRGVLFNKASNESLKALSPITELCDEYNISYLLGVEGNSEKVLFSEDDKLRSFDLCIEGFKIIVEYNNERYHPKQLDEDYKKEWLTKLGGHLTEKDFQPKFENDILKKKLAEDNGYQIYYIWNDSEEQEIINLKNIIYANIKNNVK